MKNFYSIRFERDGEIYIKILRADSLMAALEKSQIDLESIISIIKNPLENSNAALRKAKGEA
jgi:hypothetical protein